MGRQGVTLTVLCRGLGGNSQQNEMYRKSVISVRPTCTALLWGDQGDALRFENVVHSTADLPPRALEEHVLMLIEPNNRQTVFAVTAIGGADLSV